MSHHHCVVWLWFLFATTTNERLHTKIVCVVCNFNNFHIWCSLVKWIKCRLPLYRHSMHLLPLLMLFIDFLYIFNSQLAAVKNHWNVIKPHGSCHANRVENFPIFLFILMHKFGHARHQCDFIQKCEQITWDPNRIKLYTMCACMENWVRTYDFLLYLRTLVSVLVILFVYCLQAINKECHKCDHYPFQYRHQLLAAFVCNTHYYSEWNANTGYAIHNID